MYQAVRKIFFRKKRGRPQKNPEGKTKLYLGVILTALSLVLFFNLSPLKTKNNPAEVSRDAQTSQSPKADLNSPIKISADLLKETSPQRSPLRIIIPSQNIDIFINEAKVVNGYWEISENSASHGAGSANPGEEGNIVIFAHAREGLFLNLKNIQKNTFIYILTKDNWYLYIVEATKEVSPSQLEVISPTKQETLTLYTCSGFLDNKRLIVTAKPIK